MKKRIVDMTSGSPAGHVLRFAFPLMLTNMGQQLYMIADGAIVGRGAGVRAPGDGKTPLRAMAIAACLNIALDRLFVFVFHWGILGAAAASLTAQLPSFLYCAAAIRKIDCIVLDREAWRMDGRMVRSMLLFGLPVALQYVVITPGGMILQSGINLQGSLFIAGYTATNKLYALLQCFAMALGQSCCTFVAQNYGAGLHGRVRRGADDGVKPVSLLALTVTAVALLSRRQILRVFLNVREDGDRRQWRSPCAISASCPSALS